MNVRRGVTMEDDRLFIYHGNHLNGTPANALQHAPSAPEPRRLPILTGITRIHHIQDRLRNSGEERS